MAQCLLLHGWLVLLKTGACRGLPIFFEVTTNWRAGCQKFACPVRREGRPESSSASLPCHTLRKRVEMGHAGSRRRPILMQRRVGVSACRRIGHRYNDQEVSTKLMMLCKRRHAETPTRFPSGDRRPKWDPRYK